MAEVQSSAQTEQTQASGERRELTEQEIALATAALRRLTPGFLPLGIFHEVARLTVTPAIEVVPLRQTAEGNVQVLLTRREVDDVYWPNQLHVPGSVIRATDPENSFEGAFKRVFEEELKGEVPNEPVYVDKWFHQAKRGRELAHLFYVDVDPESDVSVGEWHDVTTLPEDTIEHQVEFLPQVIEAYRDMKANIKDS